MRILTKDRPMRRRLRCFVVTSVAVGAVLCPRAAAADPVGAPFEVGRGFPYSGTATWADDRGVWIGRAEADGSGAALYFTTTGALEPEVRFSDEMGASGTDVAYSSARKQFLLVSTNATAIVARTMELDGTLGAGATVSTRGVGREPSVAYHPSRNEYLAVWQRHSGARTDIVARRLSASGAPVGARERRLSQRYADNFDPDVTAARSGGYLAVWTSVRVPSEDDSQLDVMGRLATGSGAPSGPRDFRVSFHTNLQGWVHNQEASVAWNARRGEAYVVFSDGFEIFGQRLASGATRIGSNARLSSMGPEGDPLAVAQFPRVAYSAGADGYLVSWWGIDAPAVNEQIYGQHLSSQGREVASDDFQVSTCAGSGVARCEPAPPPEVLPVSGTRDIVVVWGDRHPDTSQATLARRIAAP
jgi:hypothetical protein